MGINNNIVFPQQKKFTILKGKVAFLEFDKKPNHFNTNNYDLYDIILNKFDINSNWELQNTYDTIICYRTLLFCKNNNYFFEQCYNHLNKNGNLFIDYSYGSVGEDMFKKIGYSVGFIKNNIQQYCQYTTNFNTKIISPCITSYWNDNLLHDNDLLIFRIK